MFFRKISPQVAEMYTHIVSSYSNEYIYIARPPQAIDK